MRKFSGIMLGLMLCFSVVGYADVYSPVWPPPGGVNYSFSPTDIGSSTGMTIYFNNLNPSAYGSLYWAPNGVANIWDSNFQAPTGYMYFNGFYQNTMFFASTAPLDFCSYTYGCQSVTTYLQAQAQPYDGFSNAFQSSGLASTYSGLLPGVNPINSNEVFPILGDSFQVHLEYKVWLNGQFIALNPWFNSMDTPCGGNCLQSDFNGGFWASPAQNPVPEPGSLALLGTGLIGLAGVLRHKLHL